MSKKQKTYLKVDNLLLNQFDESCLDIFNTFDATKKDKFGDFCLGEICF